MDILYIGSVQTYKLYEQGTVPSHWLYGACEMEKDGHNVIWEDESNSLFNDIKLIIKYRPAIVFIPNLNIRNHILLLILKSIGLYNNPIFAYLHHMPKMGNMFVRLLYKALLCKINHLFFLSKKTMLETTTNHFAKSQNCSVPNWGPDLIFFDKVQVENNGIFVSTGKENRDFDTLIDAFSITKASLLIITAKSHAGNSYEYLKDKCSNIPNIEIIITENNGNVYPMMLNMMAKSAALVCPLRLESLTYCVGLSTIADAEGLGKPLIITRNTYHDVDRMAYFHVVESVEDWVKAISTIMKQKEIDVVVQKKQGMQEAYQHMKKIMFN